MAKRQRTSHSDVLRVARIARLCITIVATGLALIFTWLQIKDISIPNLLQNAKPESIQKFSLIVYYFCWVFGTRIDTNSQESVFVEVPSSWRVTFTSAFLIATFFLVAAALLWSAGDEKKFALLLTLFVLFNVFGWWYLNYAVLRPIMSRSRERLIEDRAFFDLEKFNVVTTYLTGSWQLKRFGLMLFIIAIADIIVFVPTARTQMSTAISLLAPDIDIGSLDRLLPDLILLFFVLVAEMWIWIMRARVAAALNVLDYLKKNYTLSRPRAQT